MEITICKATIWDAIILQAHAMDVRREQAHTCWESALWEATITDLDWKQAHTCWDAAIWNAKVWEAIWEAAIWEVTCNGFGSLRITHLLGAYSLAAYSLEPTVWEHTV